MFNIFNEAILAIFLKNNTWINNLYAWLQFEWFYSILV